MVSFFAKRDHQKITRKYNKSFNGRQLKYNEKTRINTIKNTNIFTDMILHI
jgi:hypothetical protein